MADVVFEKEAIAIVSIKKYKNETVVSSKNALEDKDLGRGDSFSKNDQNPFSLGVAPKYSGQHADMLGSAIHDKSLPIDTTRRHPHAANKKQSVSIDRYPA